MIRGAAAYAVLPANSLLFASTSRKCLTGKGIRNTLTKEGRAFKPSLLCGSCQITASAGVAQLVRAPPCHGGGRGFESRLSRQFQWLGQTPLRKPWPALQNAPSSIIVASSEFSGIHRQPCFNHARQA